MKKSVMLVALMMTACASVSQPQEFREVPTVLVSYYGVGMIKIFFATPDGSTPRRLGTVTSGRPECFRIPVGYQDIVLLATEFSTRGSINSPIVNLQSQSHWEWSLGASLLTTRINLVPRDKTCVVNNVRKTT